MSIVTRTRAIEAHREAITQLEGLTGVYVEGGVAFTAYKETSPVNEVRVEYRATGQHNNSTVTIRVGEMTEYARNKSGTDLPLPYLATVFVDGQRQRLAVGGIIVVPEGAHHQKAWIKLLGREGWSSCAGHVVSS